MGNFLEPASETAQLLVKTLKSFEIFYSGAKASRTTFVKQQKT